MHYALAAAFPGSKVTRAFDLNPVANKVYEANFGQRPWQVPKCQPVPFELSLLANKVNGTILDSFMAIAQ